MKNENQTFLNSLEMEVICNRKPKQIKTNETSACPDVFEKLIRQSWTLEMSELFVQLLFFIIFNFFQKTVSGFELSLGSDSGFVKALRIENTFT